MENGNSNGKPDIAPRPLHRGGDLISKDQAFNLIANIVGPELLALVARLRRVEGALGLKEWDGQGLSPEEQSVASLDHPLDQPVVPELTPETREAVWVGIQERLDESTGAKDRNHDDCG